MSIKTDFISHSKLYSPLPKKLTNSMFSTTCVNLASQISCPSFFYLGSFDFDWVAMKVVYSLFWANCLPFQKISTASMILGQPVQLVGLDENGDLYLDAEALSSCLEQEEVKDTPVCLISIIGEQRQGKSFLLNFLLRRFKNLVSLSIFIFLVF